MATPVATPVTTLEQLEQRQLVWRGRHSPTPLEARTSGWSELDRHLSGFPKAGAVAIHSPQGIGEVRLLWPFVGNGEGVTAVIQPPFHWSAEALLGEQLAPERWLVVRPKNREEALWSAEQCLKSGCCDSVWLWPSAGTTQAQVRRLQLAARTGETTLFLFCTEEKTQDFSWPVDMHLALAPHPEGLWVAVPRRRQGRPVERFILSTVERWPELATAYAENKPARPGAIPRRTAI